MTTFNPDDPPLSTRLRLWADEVYEGNVVEPLSRFIQDLMAAAREIERLTAENTRLLVALDEPCLCGVC